MEKRLLFAFQCDFRCKDATRAANRSRFGRVDKWSGRMALRTQKSPLRWLGAGFLMENKAGQFAASLL
jgi:hypothetical protein